MGRVVGVGLYRSLEQSCLCLQLYALLGVGEQIHGIVRLVVASIHESVASDAVVDTESRTGHHILVDCGGLLYLEHVEHEISGEVEIVDQQPDLGVRGSTQQQQQISCA